MGRTYTIAYCGDMIPDYYFEECKTEDDFNEVLKSCCAKCRAHYEEIEKLEKSAFAHKIGFVDLNHGLQFNDMDARKICTQPGVILYVDSYTAKKLLNE